MGEAGGEDGGARFDGLAVRQRGAEIARAAGEGLHRDVLAHVDQLVVDDALDHAADGVFGPFARRHQLGVAGLDRRAAERIGLVDQHDVLAGRGQGMGGGKPGGAAADDENRTSHYSAPPGCAAMAAGGLT